MEPKSPVRGDGQQVTTRVLQQHEGEIVGMLQAGAALALAGL
jgi:hypothetical protein